ncbi:dihydrofolate reductase family protein [Stackebrandtia nassauensis]|uniref:Bifunctional deaminase-reductase domain protein n=1 Tax=Stackebrandtia nassauensis (strain DSM 44728 / CIP 108903 / NRRL B-16338 / NBRC 102104 / LLR-40K-21) TaxID=446470 RepID=D3PXH0_STANL|nr:dihydrofolate reductase family protein [Stackebrandtia nassauensis]ADD41433.1 bifunctional deaminase-reductase domain protein [Stackebrandtia nassauensis DSM 44728]
MRKLCYFVGITVDGFIAAPDGDLGHYDITPPLVEFLSSQYPETLPTPARAAMGIDAPNRRFDTVVMGRGTYEPGIAQGVASPYAHLRQYVASSSLSSPDPAVTVVSDPVATVRELKNEEGLDIWLAGGGGLAATLIDEIDELVVKVYPVVAGAGIPLLSNGFNPKALRLANTVELESGHLVLSYDLTAPRQST